jgi:hypothetical protein
MYLRFPVISYMEFQYTLMVLPYRMFSVSVLSSCVILRRGPHLDYVALTELVRPWKEAVVA